MLRRPIPQALVQSVIRNPHRRSANPSALHPV